MASPEQQGGASAEQEAAKAEFEAMQKELGPLIQKLQELMKNPDGDAKEKLKLAKRIFEILQKFKEMMGEEAFSQNEQLVQIEQFVNQVLGQLEG